MKNIKLSVLFSPALATIFLLGNVLFSAQVVVAKSTASDMTPEVNIYISGDKRIIESNGIPETHGKFPNSANPNTIAPQNYHFEVPLTPEPLEKDIALTDKEDFGVGLDGVPFDPIADEYWEDNPDSGWALNAVSSLGPDLGLDENNAHVQPNGAYHYHGFPVGLYEQQAEAQGVSPTEPDTMILVGWAADGFPIYGRWGYRDDGKTLVELRSSYQLKSGKRPEGGPPGEYNGIFDQDYEYVAGSGDLDQCNGTTGITPQYPEGTYYYVLTDSFPYVPRCFHGQPDASFTKKNIPPST